MSQQNPTFDQIPIEQLQLSMSAYASLKRLQINTLADLMHYTQEDLITLDQKSGSEVMTALEQRFGLVLPRDEML